MPRSSRCLLPLVAALTLSAPAQAATLTLGSDLHADATSIIARPADTAFWLAQHPTLPVVVPEDGQVVTVRIKGSAMREPGAADPARIAHVQTLDAAGADGARRIFLTSASFTMPVDDPGAVTTISPENLCVHQGGVVAFNTLGGFHWGGSPEAPLDPAHYDNGTPWRIFAATGGASTAVYTRDDGTKNGDTASPTMDDGRELLMQVVVVTGDDRSEPCGGPRRHVDGSAVQTGPDPMYIKVVRVGGRPQQPYVPRDRRVRVGIYCGGESRRACVGTATLRLRGTVVGRARFSLPARSAGRVAMRLDRRAFRRLDATRRLTVRLVLATGFGTFRAPLTLKR